MQFRCLRSCSL